MLKKAVGYFALKAFREMADSLTPTQRAALESGTVGIVERSLYEGSLDQKGMLSMPGPSLSPEEKRFLNEEVEQLCQMLDCWKIEEETKDLPPEAWQFLREKRFFGMVIPKEYGGLGFSAQGHAAVIAKIASRNGTASVTAMVPNSLGPGELIYRYGTEDQKNYYLPRLAMGEEIPCFALTSPQAGSDATNQKDEGILFRGEDNKLYIRLNWEKRYTTLAPIATLFGLAFKLKDPDHILGHKEDVGITLGLVPAGLPGMDTGKRHRPMGAPFQNGPHWGEDVIIPADNIIGGIAYAGKGWDPMLVNCLAIGRSVSLPASSAGMARYATRATGAYAAIRQQFGQRLVDLEMVQEGLARIGGLTYMIDSVRPLPLQDMDLAHEAGEEARPAVASAMLKYHLTEAARQISIDAMDIHGGKGVVKGPDNPVSHLYESIPVAITVEGANYLTRGMMIFGQGAFMAHPYVLEEMKAGREENMEKAGELAIKHVGSIFSNAVAGVTLGLTNGRFASVPKIDSEKLKGPDVRFYQHINRLAHAFAYTSNIAMLTLQSSLMRKERISALLGDTASHLYIASQVLRRWHTEGRRREDKPLMQWAAAYCLHRAEGALWELTANFPAPLKLMTRPVSFPRSMMPMMYGAAWWASEVNLPEEFKAVSRPALMALGAASILSSGKRPLSPPSHNLDKRVAYAISAKSEVRDHLTAGMFVPKGKENYLARLENALELAEKALPHEKKLRKLAKTNAKLNDKMPSILQSIADEVYKVHKKANREFKNVALHELKRAVKGEVFEGHLPDIHHLDVPEIWNKMKEIVRLTFREKSGPAQCSKMAHTALEEMGESIKKAQPERNSYEVGRLVTRAKDIMDRIITRAAVAQRDILTEAVDDGMRLASGGRLIERDMRRQAAIAIAQRIADKKEHNHDSFSQAAAAVLPKFVDSNTLTQSENYLNMIAEARKKRFITADIAKQLEEMYVVRSDIEQVNHYGADYTGPAEHPVPYVEPKPEPSPDPFGVRQITAKPAKPRTPR